MNYESLRISDLKPAEYNPRKISEKEMRKLCESIKSFGFVEPIVVNADGTIIGGHQRVKAAERLGMEEVPVIRVDIPKGKERALNLALNRISGEWDEERLALLLQALTDDERKLSGFDDDEITSALNQLLKAAKEDDYVPTPPADPKTKLGNLYALGEHRLLCGDATSQDDFAKLMIDAKADMVFTDPPYNIGYKGGLTAIGTQSERKAILNDSMSPEDFYRFLLGVMSNLVAHTDGAFYVCMSSSELHSLWKAFTECGGHWQSYIIWAKQRFTLSRSDYQHQFEPIMHGLSAGEANKLSDSGVEHESLPILYGWTRHAWYGGRKQSDVWMIDRPMASPEHPTMKPILLCAKAIKNSCKVGGIVLDTFGGSGSTLIAAEQTGRRCFMMELDPAYCDVIIDRWQKFTGKTAELIA